MSTVPNEAAPGPAEPADRAVQAARYDQLRAELERLFAAPVRDMVAIDAVLRDLDATHAAFKALHGGPDHQRF